MPSSFWMLGLLACGGSGEETTAPCEPSEATEVSFAPEHMLCVQIEMDPDDFEELGGQFRFGDDASDQFPGVIGHVASSCTEPFPDPYTYFSADVNVDGLEVTNAGVRKKGFVGSVLEGSQERPSLKIKTDKFEADQTLAGSERVTLNNNLTDSSRMRTCLAYSVFADAGHPTPLCNLANVMVNGESLGSYTHVEAIKKPFLRRVFGNDEGSLYESTLADFTDGHLADGLGRWEAKTDETEPSTVLLQAVADALLVEDEDLEEALDQVIDLDLFLQFWALETLVGHVDGFSGNTNNTYVYFDPDRENRAVFIPWGPDDALSDGLGAEAEEGEEGEGDGEGVAFVASEIPRRLSRHPELSLRYLETLEQLLEEVWDEGVLADRIAQFTVHVRTAEQTTDGHREAVEELSSWVDQRRAGLEQFLLDGGVEGPEEPSDCSVLGLEEFLVLAEVLVAFSYGCSVTPGWSSTLLAFGVLLLVPRRRRPGFHVNSTRRKTWNGSARTTGSCPRSRLTG